MKLSNIAIFLFAIACAGSANASGATVNQDKDQLSKAADFAFYCEQIWPGPNSRGICAAEVIGNVPGPTTHIWGNSGTVIMSSCGTSQIACNYSCIAGQTGYIQVAVYDGNGTLIGSGSRNVC